MKLLKLEVIDGGHICQLNGFNERFHQSDEAGALNPIIIAGINGSGKSKLLEVLSEIFYFLDNYYQGDQKVGKRTALRFELEYLLDNKKETHVRIYQKELVGHPVIEVLRDGNFEIINDRANAKAYLPNQIVAYSSGENQTLSKRYEDSYIEYSEAVTDLIKNPKEEGVPDTRLVFLDYKVNSYVFIANSVFRSKKQLGIITNTINRLDSLESFRITIQLDPKYKGRQSVKLTPELNKYFAVLKKCATCYYYEPENDKTTLDFYLNQATIELFRKYFTSAFQLYTSLYKLDLLNDILIRREKRQIARAAEYENQKLTFPELSVEDKVFHIENIRVNLKGLDTDIDYYDLSDGEHQFIHVFGSLLMIDNPNTLFLLDEPETHFNPQWRSKFIVTLNQIKHSKNQDFYITTHSPFLIGDSDMEHVLIFNKGKVTRPEVQTYGLSMERLLKIAFGVIPPMSEKALKDIQGLQKSTDIEEIEERIDEFGESIEKFYLYDRLSELSNPKSKKK